MLIRVFRFSAFVMLISIAQFAVAIEPTVRGEWPQWRGPNRDGISQEKGLLREWPKDGPALVWQNDSVGVGYSSMAIANGRIYTQGDLDGVEHILALNASDGKLLWAVQPQPVSKLLQDRLANELKQLDRNQDGEVDEFESLSRFGWSFHKFDAPEGGDVAARAKDRAQNIFVKLDKDGDQSLAFAEAGNVFGDHFQLMDQEDKSADAATLAGARSSALMKQLDKDGNGNISREEARGSALDRAFNRADMKVAGTDRGDDQVSAAELNEYFTKAEPGRDGVVNLSELSSYYVQNKLSGDGKLTLAELKGPFGGYRNGMGDGPRGTPTVDGDRVYVEGGNGDVTCLNAASGQTIWHVNLPKSYGGGTPGWGYSESPLIVGELVIVTPGGQKGTLLALTKMDGQKVWQSTELTEGAHYSSPLLAEIAGVKQIVQFSAGSVFGVSLDDGKLLWKYAAPANGTANCCMPIVDDEYVFASSSYGTGAGLTRITGGGNNLQAEEVYFDKKMQCHHGGMVKIGDYVYSNAGGSLLCTELRSGKTMWQDRSIGKGSLIAADGMLFLFSENHQAAVVEATPEGYREHGKFKIAAHGRPSWAHPAIAGGKLFIRDQEWIAAYEIRTAQ